MQHFPLRSSGRRILNYLDDWLILARSLDTLISHIDSLLIHLESLRLCLNMQRTFSPPASREIAWGWEPASREIAWGMRPCLSWDRVGMRACLSWDRVEMKSRLSRDRAAANCLPCAFFRQGSSVQLKVFQRLLGLKGGGFSGITSGINYTCARCSYGWNLESRERRGLRDVCVRGHIEALTQPRSTSAGGDGWIDSRLGSRCEGNASFGTVAGISEPVAHKPPGAGSSLLSSKGFSATAGTAACTGSHRQHVCGFVYKSSRRVEIAPRVGGIKWMSGQTEIQMRWLQRLYLGFVTG